MASIELILAIPPLFLLLILFKIAGTVGVERQFLVTHTRTTVWAGARGGSCQPLDLESGYFGSCNNTKMDSGSQGNSYRNIWDQMDSAAGIRIARDVRAATYPEYVTGEYRTGFLYQHPWVWYGTFLEETFTVGNSTYFTLSDKALPPGYDKVLREEIDRVLSTKRIGLGDGPDELFKGVFPGAR